MGLFWLSLIQDKTYLDWPAKFLDFLLMPIENCFLFYLRDILAAIAHRFGPSPECDEWLNKVWRTSIRDEKRRQVHNVH
jgi:hypothetical protein